MKNKVLIPAAIALMAVSADARAADRVELTGALPFPQAMTSYAGQEVFLLTSAYEGMPLVVLHALAEGLLPVCSDIASGVSQLIADGAPVSTFPVGDMEAAADRLAALQADREGLLAARREARAFGRRLDIRDTVAGLANILRELPWPAVDVWQDFHAPPHPPGTGWKGRWRRRMPR